MPNNTFRASDFNVDSRSGTIFEQVKDLTYFTDSNVMSKFSKSTIEEKHFSSFNQILSLTLKESGKDKVLNAINELEKLDIVLAAEPSFNWEPVTNNTGIWRLDKNNTTEARNIATGQGTGVMEDGVLDKVEHIDTVKKKLKLRIRKLNE